MARKLLHHAVMSKPSKSSTQIANDLRRAADEGRYLREQSRRSAEETAQKREQDAESWLSQTLPGLLREAGLGGKDEIYIGWDAERITACRRAGLFVRIERDVMSGMDMAYVRVPGAHASTSGHRGRPFSEADVTALEREHAGVWVDTESQPGVTRVYTSTADGGEAVLSVVFGGTPTMDQLRTAAAGLFALCRQLEALERR
jgi:hypothetical protein